MEEDRTFTSRDALLGICQTVEVGLPWQDRWSKTDEFNGRCTSEQVGKPKQSPAADQEPAAEQSPFEPLTRERRKQLLQELTDKLLIEAHQNPMAFADDASTQLNKLLDLAGKQDAGAVDVRQITIDRFIELTLEEKDAAMVDVLLSFVPADVLPDALERLGVDSATWDSMKGVRALQARINMLEGEKVKARI